MIAGLLAPNGKPSNLTPEQYLLVRTDAFKEFFGDWEKLALTKLYDSAIDEVSLKRLEDSVSKVVDSNGEPLVLYHGTDVNFNVYDLTKIGEGSDLLGKGIYLTEKKDVANFYANLVGQKRYIIKYEKGIFDSENPIYEKDADKKAEKHKVIYQFFVNAKNVIDINKIKVDNNIKQILIKSISDLFEDKSEEYVNDKIDFANKNYKEIRNYRGMLLYLIYLFPDSKEEVLQYIKNKYDCILFEPSTEFETDLGEYKNYVVFNPEQIKLADGSNTTFDSNNPDIRFNDGGVIVNPTEIECHNCHWHWKVKDGGDDLFICHKCNYDNSKFYKFEGLKGEKILDTITYKKGGRTISQTPAPKKDQIKGSDKNKEGSSKDLKSAKTIELSDNTIEAIKNKVDEHNEKYPKKKITIDSAKAVVRRGMGAYSSSYRPTISGGKPNSRVAWGLARLNAFLYKIINGKSKSGKYSQDNDLIEELGYKVQKYADGGDIQAYEEAMGISEFDEGGETKPKKVYVSIQLSYEFKKIEKDSFGYSNNYFRKYDEKPFEELKNGVLEGLVGVSSSPNNIAEWFINRDCLIVMDYEEFMAINETETINYYDPYQLMKNNLFLFKRLYANVSRRGEQEGIYIQTLIKICEKLVSEINLEMNVSEGQRSSELYRISRFLSPYETKAFTTWIEENSIKIESPIDLTNAILDFNKLNDSYLGSGFENPVLTFDELLPIVEKGITNASKIYESEQEIVLTNRRLSIPKKSQLFFIAKDELGRDTDNNRDELIKKYNLKELYKVYFVDRQEIQKYRDKWLKKEEEKFNQKFTKGLEDLELKKQQVVEELLNLFLNKSINSFKEQYEKYYIQESSETKMFYDDNSDDYAEIFWYSVPLVQLIVNKYYEIVQTNWSRFIESKRVKDLNLYSFSNFCDEVKYNLKDFFRDNYDELDKLNDWREIRGNGYLSLSNIEYLLIKSVDDYENLPEWISYKELAKMYLNKMGSELYRYYMKKEIYLGSEYKDGGEAKQNKNTLTNKSKMENEILIVDMNMYHYDTSVNFMNQEIPLKLNAPKNEVRFIEFAIENNIDFEQWGDAGEDDTSWGYTFEIPLFKYIEYLKTEKFYTGGELKKGIKTEMEHKDTIKKIKTGDYNIKESAELIAKDHLEENDKYYTHLIEMESKFEDGGKVNSIKSKKGDIKISLDENWYSDDTDVELVPVSELIKFREFDRKVKPKYNQDNSRDNINHLKYMFQRDGVKEPIIIEYSPESNSVLVIEGNHRINSAIDLGMEYLPARVVLKKYGNFNANQLKNTISVSGVTADEYGYIPSNLKPSKVGIQGATPIVYGDGGIIEGRLHSECGDDGCGRKFQVGEGGHIIEAERDEAVIVADAFDDNEKYTIKGTPSEVASALNVMGGGKNFDKGAEIVKDGTEIDVPQLKKQAVDTDVDDIIDSGSIIINRRSMADEEEYEVTGTPKQIASAINSLDGNGVVIEKGATIKKD
jgi:hypothetical protein